jgi:hypothetical protein
LFFTGFIFSVLMAMDGIIMAQSQCSVNNGDCPPGAGCLQYPSNYTCISIQSVLFFFVLCSCFPLFLGFWCSDWLQIMHFGLFFVVWIPASIDRVRYKIQAHRDRLPNSFCPQSPHNNSHLQLLILARMCSTRLRYRRTWEMILLS